MVYSLLFLTSMCFELLSTGYTMAVVSKQKVKAILLALAFEPMRVGLLLTVLESSSKIPSVCAISLGYAAGTFILMRK